MRFLALIALFGCGGSTPAAETPAAAPEAPEPDSQSAITCDSLRPCSPELGVCLRCTTPGNPEWVWSEAPGSPHVFALSPGNVSMPHPDLQQDCCWAHPFDNHVPDCDRFQFDEQGMPIRTRRIEADIDDLYRYTYANGRVVKVEVDAVPFCECNDFGDECPCGEPDGVFDGSYEIAWEGRRATMRNNEWRFDERGRLVEWRTSRESGRNTFTGDLVTEQVRNVGRELTNRFHYEDGRLVRVDRTFEDGTEETLRWEYDARGWPLRRIFQSGTVEYENSYDSDGRLVRRTIRPTESPTQRGAPTTFHRRYDDNGLLIEERRDASRTVGERTLRWTRNAQGVPLAHHWDGVQVDQRCLEPLAHHFQ